MKYQDPDISEHKAVMLGLFEKATSMITLRWEEIHRKGQPYYVIALFDRALAQIRSERYWVVGSIGLIEEDRYAVKVPTAAVGHRRTCIKELSGGA
jgi:hypothetical protein